MKEQKGRRISHRVVAEGMSCWGGEKLMEGRVNIFGLEKIVELSPAVGCATILVKRLGIPSHALPVLGDPSITVHRSKV